MALFLTSQVINYSLLHCGPPSPPPPLPRPSSCFNKILPGCISRSWLMGKFTSQPPYVSFRHPSGCSRYEPHPLLLHCPAQAGQWVGAGSRRVAPSVCCTTRRRPRAHSYPQRMQLRSAKNSWKEDTHTQSSAFLEHSPTHPPPPSSSGGRHQPP